MCGLGLAEIRARTALLSKPGAAPDPIAAPTKEKLTGLDLAALIAPPPAVANTGAIAAIPEAQFAAVPGAALAVAAQGTKMFAPLLRSLDALDEVPVRQRAFLRVLETFGSEWIADASSRAIWNGTAQLAGGLKKRNLWQPFVLPHPGPTTKLDHAEQERFIDEVLAPCWKKMVADTATAPSLAENMRGLIELHGLWEGFAKGFWPHKRGALALDEPALLALTEHAPAKEAMFAAAAIAPLAPGAAEKIAELRAPQLSKEQIAELLYVGEKSPALRALTALLGARLPALHPVASWHAWVNEPDVRDVKAWTTRLHGMSLALPHLESAADALWSAWKARVSGLDLEDVETAAKVHALASSLRSTRGFGADGARRTLELMPAKTVAQLALMPVAQPKIEKGKPPPPADPIREVRDQAASSLYGDATFSARLLDGGATANERRERLKLSIALLDKITVNSDPVSRTVNALLADPSTIDEGATKTPSEVSVQTLLSAAQRIASGKHVELALDPGALERFLPARPSAELAWLLQPAARGSDAAWIGAASEERVRRTLIDRLQNGTLEPHVDLLRAALVPRPIAIAQHEATLERWLRARAQESPEQHGAALLVVAETFGYGLNDADNAILDALIARSFAELPDPRDRDSVEKMFGLAKKLSGAARLDRAKLAQHVADRAPLELCLAPYVDDYPILPSAMYEADLAFRARIKQLGPQEARRFLESAPDAAALTERIGLLSRAACGLGMRDPPRADRAKLILEQAIQPALSKLAKIGEPANDDQRRAVLFLPSGAKAAGVSLQLSAAEAAPFAKAASTEDLLKLCLDAAIAQSGVRESAAAALEERIVRAPIGEKRDRLRAMLDGWEKLTCSRFSGGKVEETRPWHEWVGEELDRLAGRPWSSLWAALDQQAAAALSPAGIGARVDNVVALYPPSRDRNVALAKALRTDQSGIPFSTLATLSSWELSRSDDTVLRPDRRLLAASLLGHPEGPFALIGSFEGRASIADVPPRLSALWKSFDADAKRSVATESFERLFTLAYGDRYHSKPSDPKIRSALETALDTEVFAKLAADPELEKLVDRLKPIFAALPRKVQARVATAFALAPPPSNDAPAVLRCLLENAGVVAIKVAQQICEDPEVPQRFRDVLESLRDQNLEVDVFGAWSQIGKSNATYDAERQGYTLLGKRLGTGSVKQANRLLDATHQKQPAVIAFLKPGAAEEIEESLRALAVDAELQPIVGRVRSMLMRELDLDLEARAFRTMERHLAPWSFIRVPKVFGSSRETLVREMSPGTPVSAILRERTLDAEEKRVLGETYRSLVQAALDPARFVAGSGFVLTDPHQGNVALDRAPDGRVLADLFDPGQYETLKAAEAAMFVRLVVHLSREKSWFAPKKAELVEELAVLLEKNEPARAAMRVQLGEAWEQARASAGRDPEPGAFVRAWLFAAADRGVPVPDAYFGMAKMLHTIDAQCRDLGLPDVIREEVSRLYKAELPLMKAIHKIWPWG